MDEMDHSSGHDAKRKEKIPSAEGRGWNIRTEEADLLDNVSLNSPLVGHLMNQLPTILAMEILGIRRRRPAEGEKAVREKNRRTRRLQTEAAAREESAAAEVNSHHSTPKTLTASRR